MPLYNKKMIQRPPLLYKDTNRYGTDIHIAIESRQVLHR
jgi:hypothetical protein